MKKKAPEPQDASLELLDRLLGPVEELTLDELNAAIAAAGIDLSKARERLYAQVSELRSRAWERNAQVTPDIASLLAQLRPAHLPTSDPKVAQQAATTWIRDLLERPRPQAGPVEFAAAARNLDGELGDADKDVLRELEDELRRKSDESE